MTNRYPSQLANLDSMAIDGMSKGRGALQASSNQLSSFQGMTALKRGGSSATAIKNRDHSLSELFGSNRPLDRLKTRNPVFNSSYKTCSNMGTKLPESIKRLQNDYIKNNGGDVNDLVGSYQTDRLMYNRMVSNLKLAHFAAAHELQI